MNEDIRTDWVYGAVSPAVHEHHADLWSELSHREADLVRAVDAGEDFDRPRARLVEFVRDTVVPHLESEETVLYGTARGVGATALAQSLELDHKSLLSLLEHIVQARSGLDAALTARAFVVLFVLRMEKEETVLLPTLRAAGVDVEGLLAGKVELTGAREDG